LKIFKEIQKKICYKTLRPNKNTNWRILDAWSGLMIRKLFIADDETT